MQKLIFSVIILICGFSLFASAQVKKGKRKTPSVKAVVTIKTEKMSEIKEPVEEDKDIWNKFYSKKYGFRIEFPAKVKDIFDDERDSFSTYETSTKKASYGLMLKNLPVSLSNKELAEIYETVISEVEDPKKSLTISKRDVYLDGKLGKEIVFEEKGRIVFTRCYILEQKLFMLSVSLQKKEYSNDFEKWVKKFFDSFSIEAKNISET
jgi:hypothetical protein